MILSNMPAEQRKVRNSLKTTSEIFARSGNSLLNAELRIR
jgi:hypothetical protein